MTHLAGPSESTAATCPSPRGSVAVLSGWPDSPPAPGRLAVVADQ